MPGMVPPVPDERAGLLGYLEQQRYVIRVAAYGLTDQQIRLTPTAGTLSMGGLVKHVAATESTWIDTVLQQRVADVEAYAKTFAVSEGDSLAGLLTLYDEVAARTESVIEGIDDLGHAVPVPQGVPWFPPNVEAWSVRWVLLHLIEETARHAGHADMVREAIDGATAFPLLAAVEHWPATPWLTPWQANAATTG